MARLLGFPGALLVFRPACASLADPMAVRCVQCDASVNTESLYRGGWQQIVLNLEVLQHISLHSPLRLMS
jgi:hypothetical protein